MIWHRVPTGPANVLVFTLLGSLLFGCSSRSSPDADATIENLKERREFLETQEQSMSQEAQARTQRSIALLQSEIVPVIDHLRVIEDEKESKRRTTEEVATRAMALCIVAVKEESLEQEFVDRLVKDFELSSASTPDERAFVADTQPSDHDRIQFAWRYECYRVTFWALGIVDILERPDSICDVRRAVAFMQENGRKGFLRKAKLRSQAELLDAADLIYRYHWAVVDARVNGREAPGRLDGGVVMERHHALNWLIGYDDQEWDDVSTDT